MPRLILLFILLFVLPLQAHPGSVATADLRGAVSPASAAYLERVLRDARAMQAELVVFSVDTPGGLDTAMRRMIQEILASPVPVAMFVSPSGARAASAGTYLLYASHVAAMAPGTNLGAATPVAIGPGGKDKPAPGGKPGTTSEDGSKRAMEAKAIQDAAAYVRGLAQWRGRNAEWAERAVREAESLSAEEAVKLKVVDVMADDLAGLLERLHGRQVKMEGGRVLSLDLAEPSIVPVAPNWQERFLAAIADPNIALILLMVGIYGLLFEFMSPGMALPGVLGGISLLLALYGLALLPVNWVGVALILLGVALMVGEAFLPSFGVLGIGGIAAFVAGTLMLMDPDIPGFSISWAFIIPFAVVSGLAAAGIGILALRTRKRPPVSGREVMVGATVLALENIDGEGWVQAFGERWQARSSRPLPKGGQARIVGVEGLTLVVEPTAKGEQS